MEPSDFDIDDLPLNATVLVHEVEGDDTMDSDNRTYRAVLTAMLVLGALANLVLLLALAHTWKFWRQVKWYVILLVVGNWLEVVLTFSVELHQVTAQGFWQGSDASCKALMSLAAVGPSVAAMAVAATSLHVLLTAITGCQGNALRHSLVIGLFVLLSLPMPVSKIFIYHVEEMHFMTKSQRVCTDIDFSRDPGQLLYYYIGSSIAVLYFPVVVFLCSLIAAVIVIVVKARGNSKGEDNASDAVIAGLQGVVLMVCVVPYVTFSLVGSFTHNYSFDIRVVLGLLYLSDCRNFISAIVTVVFAYVHAYRNRGEGYVTPTSDRHGGERQKLVN